MSLRIALLTDGISPYVTGGMQRHSFNLCRALVQQGAHVDLYHCDPKRRGAASLDAFTSEERESISSYVIEFPDFGKMPGHYIRESYAYSRSIADRLLRNAAVDFIYAKGFTAWELLNLKSKGKELPPIGVNLHGYEMFQKQPGLKARLQATLFLKSPALFAVKHADYLFSYGGKISDLIASLGVAHNRIVNIPGGIGSEWLAKNASPVTPPVKFLFAGRAERRKGIEELTIAIKRLQVSHKGQFQFTFLGPVAYSDRIKGCNYTGELHDPVEIRKVYTAHDVLCVPSYSEGMPNVILEAMASGLAVLATNVGAVSTLVNAENGWLLDSPDPEAVYRHLSEIIAMKPETVAGRKQSSLERVGTSFTWEKIGRQTMEFIRQAVTK